MKKRTIAAVILCFVTSLFFAGCAQEKKSNEPIVLLVAVNVKEPDGSESVTDIFINSAGEYFSVGTGKCTYSTESFKKEFGFSLLDVLTGRRSFDCEYKVEGNYFSEDDTSDLSDRLSNINYDSELISFMTEKYDEDLFDKEMNFSIDIWVPEGQKVNGIEMNRMTLLDFSNRSGGERKRNKNTFIGDCRKDPNALKIALSVLEHMDFNDEQKEFFMRFTEYISDGTNEQGNDKNR